MWFGSLYSLRHVVFWRWLNPIHPAAGLLLLMLSYVRIQLHSNVTVLSL
jgi:hypothetical protein